MISVSVSLRGRSKPWSRRVRTGASTAGELISELCINPLEVLVKVNGEFIPDTERLRDGDMLELLEITSRG